jgi:hypothetical protein
VYDITQASHLSPNARSLRDVLEAQKVFDRLSSHFPRHPRWLKRFRSALRKLGTSLDVAISAHSHAVLFYRLNGGVNTTIHTKSAKPSHNAVGTRNVRRLRYDAISQGAHSSRDSIGLVLEWQMAFEIPKADAVTKCGTTLRQSQTVWGPDCNRCS